MRPSGRPLWVPVPPHPGPTITAYKQKGNDQDVLMGITTSNGRDIASRFVCREISMAVRFVLRPRCEAEAKILLCDSTH